MEFNINDIITYVTAGAAIVTLAVQMYAAFKSGQYAKLITLAGGITLEVAKLAGYDNAAKRNEAVKRLYGQAPTVARNLFTEQQFIEAVEKGWATIAKPQMQGGQ